MAAWVVSSIRASNPDATIDWAVEASCAEIIDRESLVNRVIEFPRDRWLRQRHLPQTWREQLACYFGLRRHRYDVGIDFQGHLKTALALRIARPRRRVGLRSRDPLAARMNPTIAPQDGHQIDDFQLLASAVCETTPVSRPRLPSFDNPFSSHRVVTLNTGSSRSEKAVPTQVLSKIAGLAASDGFEIMVLGGKDDPRISIGQDRVGQTKWRETMAALQHSCAHICGDTGTGHLAAGYGVPTVSIFTDMHNPPARFAPRGPYATYDTTIDASTIWLNARQLIDARTSTTPGGSSQYR